MNEIQKYIRRIRNDYKKGYAYEYFNWVKGGKKGLTPDYSNISSMAAQEVRMTIDSMLQ